jgi:hypothetical protein
MTFAAARPIRLILATALALVCLALPAARAGAADGAPVFDLISLATPTNFIPGDAESEYIYDLRIMNVGSGPTDGSPIAITDTLPAGVEVKGVQLRLRTSNDGSSSSVDAGSSCAVTKAGGTETVTCTISEALPEALEPALVAPAEQRQVVISVFTPGSVPEGTVLANHVEVEGGGAAPAAITTKNEASSKDAASGITYFHSSPLDADGQPSSQAGSHPFDFLASSFAINTRVAPPGTTAHFLPAGGDIKDVEVALPPGLAGNPGAAERCTAQEFATSHGIFPGHGSFFVANACPPGSVVGVVFPQQVEGISGLAQIPIYNLVPPPGMPAQLGFQVLGFPFFIDTEVRPDRGYRVVGVLHNLSQIKRLTASTVLLWGTPGDAAHDAVRGECLNQLNYFDFPVSLGDCPSGIANPKPFLRLPTDCDTPLETALSLSNWTDASLLEALQSQPAPLGCNLLSFEPSLEAHPTTDVADSPTGLKAHLHLPQDEDPAHFGTADLEEAVVTLPEGLVVNPASANGLGACSASQIGLTSAPGASPATFSAAPAACPRSALIGSAEIDAPAIDHTLKGGVYVATPYDNPFDSLLAIYIAVDDAESGIVLKLPGHVLANPDTGQLTTVFPDAPQQPFDDFRLEFSAGPLAALRTPAVCGSYQTEATLTPYSAPESGPPATEVDAYSIDKAPGGGECPTTEAALPNSPSFEIGTEAPIAAAYSPLVLRLARPDGSQEFTTVSTTLPPGLIGRAAGLPPCSEAALAAAEAKSGTQEKASPSCPEASRVGSVKVGAGAGPAPFYTTGTAYWAGPYKGGPFSLAIVTPAAAGPYDLGTVVSRVALRLDPETAQVSATSDPIPHILKGIPLDVRSIALRLDRPSFILNPTSCKKMGVSGALTSVFGQVAPLADRFQVGECSRLGFKPKLSLALKGATKRTGNPRLVADLSYPKGTYANIARAQVKLPKAAFLDQGHIRTVCTRVQFAAEQCPAASVYGKASAQSPLVDYTLSGPVYLRSSDNILPDLVADLHGPASQPVRVALVGRTDSVKGALRNTFDTVPDVPASHFHLELFGGKRGLVDLSQNLCAHTYRAVVKLDAQNGKVHDTEPAIGTSCKGKKHKRRGQRP